MAAPIKSVLANDVLRRPMILSLTRSVWTRSQSSWTRLFKRQKEEEKTEEGASVRRHRPDDGPKLFSQLESLKKKTSLVTVRGYNPPQDVEQKVASIAEAVVGAKVDSDFPLSDRRHRFQILNKSIEEFDHQIPNTELTSMTTLEDVVAFFSIPVRDQSSYEDLAKLDLPPNLHIQMDPVRFSAETDTFFDGQTAFSGRPTVVSSLKYSRKYKGNQGESRNERSVTEFERNREAGRPS